MDASLNKAVLERLKSRGSEEKSKGPSHFDSVAKKAWQSVKDDDFEGFAKALKALVRVGVAER